MTKKVRKINCLIVFGGVVALSIFCLIAYRLLTTGQQKISLPPASRFPIQTFPPPTPSLSPTPSPRPLTFAEMNKLYGPCTYLSTLMYHHIQPWELAQKEKQTSITVDTEVFRKQMQYLKEKGYTILGISDLINFFDSGGGIPKKAILLTFDDAYRDFYSNVYPILREQGYKAIVFTPTGLVNNFGYLNWSEIEEMNQSGLAFFANHTWSHKNVRTDTQTTEKEIATADTQLNERGLNLLKVFAYPYGSSNSSTIVYLQKLGYKLAFTTQPGSILCKGRRFDLPRVRIGNRDLSSFGF